MSSTPARERATDGGRYPHGGSTGQDHYCDVVLAYLRERVWNPRVAVPQREWHQTVRMVRAIVRERVASANVLLAEDDLVQEGVFALIRAADRFDDTRGVPWTAFARQSIRYALADIVRQHDVLNREDRELFTALRTAQDRCLAGGNTTCSAQHLAEQTGIPVDRVRRLLHTAEQAYSPTVLDDANSDPDDVPLVSSAEDTAVTRADLHTALRGLSDRDRAIVWARYAEETPAHAVAARYCISVGRVSQIAARAARSLRGQLAG